MSNFPFFYLVTPAPPADRSGRSRNRACVYLGRFLHLPSSSAFWKEVKYRQTDGKLVLVISRQRRDVNPCSAFFFQLDAHDTELSNHNRAVGVQSTSTTSGFGWVVAVICLKRRTWHAVMRDLAQLPNREGKTQFRKRNLLPGFLLSGNHAAWPETAVCLWQIISSEFAGIQIKSWPIMGPV